MTFWRTNLNLRVTWIIKKMKILSETWTYCGLINVNNYGWRALSITLTKMLFGQGVNTYKISVQIWTTRCSNGTPSVIFFVLTWCASDTHRFRYKENSPNYVWRGNFLCRKWCEVNVLQFWCPSELMKLNSTSVIQLSYDTHYIAHRNHYVFVWNNVPTIKVRKVPFQITSLKWRKFFEIEIIKFLEISKQI